MEKIGKSLQEAREQLGLTLEEAERSTRIRIYHLESLERGDVDALPSSVQARGFLGNYAEFLGLDVDAVLRQYKEHLQSSRSRTLSLKSLGEPSTRSSVQIHSRRPRWLSFDLFFATGVTLVVLAVLIWGGNRIMIAIRQQPEPPEAASDFLLPDRTLTPTVTQDQAASPPETMPAFPATETPIPTQPLILGFTGSVNIRVVAEKRTWVRIVVDGVEDFSDRLAPGEELEFKGERTVEVATGNGGGLRVFYNGQDQGLMGEVGQVVIQVWTIHGILTLTPTPTRTPTITEPSDETPTLTSTPQPAAGE